MIASVCGCGTLIFGRVPHQMSVGEQGNKPRRGKPGMDISCKRSQMLPVHFGPSNRIIFWMI